MPGSTLRALILLSSLTALAVLLGALYGRATGFIALFGLAGLPVFFWLWVPRMAHSAFRRGDFARAKLLYRALKLATLSAASRAAIDVSLAACATAMDAFERALQVLARVDEGVLGESARAAWLNNRAYALARSGGDAEVALRCCDEAIATRPDVAGFHHTRGVALLAQGRLDEAIAELERLWDDLAGQSAMDQTLLEAERCYDLGVAWREKGDLAYAADYFQRAHQTAPASRWAQRAAAAQVASGQEPTLPAALDGLLEP